MGFLQGKLIISVLCAAPWNKLLLGEAAVQAVSCSKSLVKLVYQNCLGKEMKQEPKRSHDSWDHCMCELWDIS